MQTASRFPKLNSFIATMLSRLITKQVWNDKRLWEGFVKCCKVHFCHFLTSQLQQPQFFPVLLQLPKERLDGAIQMIPEVKRPLIEYCLSNRIAVPFSKEEI